jgi:Uma2 family endonuclease
MTTLVLPDLPMTADDFAAMTPVRGLRIELNEGTLEVAAAAQVAWHSRVARRIATMIESHGRVALTEAGVVLAPRTVRVPDLIRFVAGVVPDEFASQFPVADIDLVVEIVSPESRYRDHEIKPVEYRAAGVPEMWIVTPHKIPGEATSDALITVHRFDSSTEPVTHLLREIEG